LRSDVDLPNDVLSALGDIFFTSFDTLENMYMKNDHDNLVKRDEDLFNKFKTMMRHAYGSTVGEEMEMMLSNLGQIRERMKVKMYSLVLKVISNIWLKDCV
jgi:hypothetical protein